MYIDGRRRNEWQGEEAVKIGLGGEGGMIGEGYHT
jgi:hypothetical protein